MTSMSMWAEMVRFSMKMELLSCDSVMVPHQAVLFLLRVVVAKLAPLEHRDPLDQLAGAVEGQSQAQLVQLVLMAQQVLMVQLVPLVQMELLVQMEPLVPLVQADQQAQQEQPAPLGQLVLPVQWLDQQVPQVQAAAVSQL